MTAEQDTTDRDPAYKRISDSIRVDILERRLLPGDRLPTESQLASHFDVGRSTVREALRDLSSQGIVETTRGASGGTFVVVPNTTILAKTLTTGIELMTAASDLSVEQLLEARELIEVPAARLASMRASDVDLEQLKHLAAAAKVRPGWRALGINWEFHMSIVRASGNPLLELMEQPIFEVLRKRFGSMRLPDGFQERVEEEHRTIGNAIADRDQQAATGLMQEHLRLLRPHYKLTDTRLNPR